MTSTQFALASFAFLGTLAALALFGRLIRLSLEVDRLRRRLEREEQARIHHVARLACTSTEIARNVEVLAQHLGQRDAWRNFGRN